MHNLRQDKKQIPWRLSLSLNWENKTYKFKRSIILNLQRTLQNRLAVFVFRYTCVSITSLFSLMMLVMYSTAAMPRPYHSSMIVYLTIGKFSFLLVLSSLFFLKEQYSESAHAQNFDFCSSCREIKRFEESKRTVKNPFPSRLAWPSSILH